MENAYKHLRATPIKVTEDKIFYNEEDIRQQISTLDPHFDSETSSQERATFKTNMFELMRQSTQHLQKPTQDFIPVPQELTKHFMMVAPLHPELPFTPDQFIESYAKWEVLRRALVQSGAEITPVDPRKKGNPFQFFARDGYIKIGDAIMLPDQDYIGQESNKTMDNMSQLLFMLTGTTDLTGQDYSKARFNQKKEEFDKLEAFLEQQDERVFLLQETAFDGGNVITDPATKSIFIGHCQPSNEEEERLDRENRETLEQVVHKKIGNNWNIYNIPLNLQSLDSVDYEKYALGAGSYAEKGTTKFLYHLDLGMSEPLSNGKILIYPGITSPETYQKMRDIIGDHRIIEIKLEEALNLGTNLVNHGMNVVMSKASNRLRGILNNDGFRVFDASDYGLKNFVIMDSGPHCLTNELTPRFT